MNLLFVRHCQSSGQTPDAALTDTGRKQARELSRFLADFEIDRLISSPYTRARQTIEVFAESSGLAVDPDLGFEFWNALRDPDVFEVELCAARPPSMRRVCALS